MGGIILDFIDYRNALGIGFDNRELENLFFNRIFNELNELNAINEISRDEYLDFCRKTGYRMQHGIVSDECWNAVMKVLQDNSRSIKEFLPYYVYFCSCQNDILKKEALKNIVCNCLEKSHIPYDIFEENGTFFCLP